jgi:arsenate reductase
MAEGWTCHLHGGTIEAFSAGTHPKGLDPRAVEVMAEVGVDISRQGSTRLEAVELSTMDLLITVCGDADKNCPLITPPPRVEHHGFDDPPRLLTANPSVGLAPYRRVRDEIRDFVEKVLPIRIEALD